MSAAGDSEPGPVPLQHKTYSSLVSGDEDLTGHIAYAFYKRDKLKFCADVRAKYGRAPTPEEVRVFIDGSNLETRLRGYRTEAEALLERFAEIALEEAVAEVKRDAKDDLLKELRASKSILRVCGEALIGSVAVAAMWALIVLTLYTSDRGVKEVAREVFDLEVRPAPTQQAPSR